MAKGGYSGGVKVLVSPEIEFDMAEFRRKCVKLKNTIRDVLKSIDDKNVEIEIDANISRAKKKIEDLKDEAEETATLEVDVDKGLASAKLAALTRDRIVEIKTVVNAGAFLAAKSAIESLSGAGALRETVTMFRTLTKQATTLSGLLNGIKASGMVTLGAAATHAVGGVSALVSGMGKLLPIASALPGVAAGIFAGFKGISTVFADAAERMDGLGYSFKNVNKAIGDNAWPQFGAALQSLADSALPRLESGMGKVGGAIGSAADDMLKMINNSRNMGAISTVLDRTAEAIGRMGPGMGNLVTAFSGLAEVGSSFLPQMASWFNEAAEGAARWVAEGMKTGSIADGIRVAVDAAKTLAGAIGDVLGIFGAVGTAAEAAGYSLSGIAGVLDRVHAAMDSMAGQQLLIKVFDAAGAAIDAFTAACGDLTGVLGTVGNNLRSIMVPAATAAGTAVNTLARTFQSMVSSGGVADFFTGVSNAMTALGPSADNLGVIFGNLASFAGTAASVMGSVLATAIQTLAPVVATLGPKLGEVATQLGGVLVGALQAAAPLLKGLADAIAAIPTPVLTALATGLLGVGAAAKGLSAFNAVTSTFKTLSPVLGVISSAFAKLSPLLSGLGRAFAFVITKITPVGAAISLLVAAFALLWTHCEPFREFFINLWNGIVEAWNTALTWITSTFIPAFQGAFAGIGEFFSGVWSGIVTAFQNVWTAIQTVWDGFMSVFGPIWSQYWENVRTVIGTVFVSIKTVVSTAINAVKGIINAVLAIIRGDWSGAWQAIKGVASTVWNGIKGVINTVIAGVSKIITNTLKTIQGTWSTVWNWIKNLASSVWNGIKSVVSTAINAVRTTITTIINGIKNTWNSVWNSVKSFFSNTWNTIKSTARSALNNLKSTIQNGINNAVNFIRQLPSKARSALSNIGSVLVNAGKNLISGFVNGIKSMFGKVSSTLKGLTSKLTSWKGPESLDKRILTPAGKYVIQGFLKGLESQYSDVRRSLQAFTDDIGDSMNIAVSPTLTARGYSVGSGEADQMSNGSKVTINQYYPQAAPDSAVRDEVARGIALAASI